jgi:tRNA pseudouridine38-40 synthase
MSAAAKLLVGGHDFRNFTMGGVSCLRTLEEVAVEREGGFILFRFFSKVFARGMVRKMVAVLLEIGAGRAQIGLISRLLDPSYQPPRAISPAPAENLLLLDVRYPDVVFKVERKSLDRLLRGLREGAVAGRLREVCLKRLAEVRL